MVVDTPPHGVPGEHRYRLHPLTAWTSQREELGVAPQDLIRGRYTVVAARLPEGWPLVIQGPPALVWIDLAEAGADGRSAIELAESWAEQGAAQRAVITDLRALLRSWADQGLVELTDSVEGATATAETAR